ncbi:MAG TPA: NifU family protein [Aequorivita sp.]|nr:NifU family protein [Aequorivita sp.]
MTTHELTLKVEEALEEIRPYLQNDGGDIALVSIDDGKVVNIQLLGTCVDCSINQMTLKSGVEMTIKKYAPQIEKVVSITHL